MFVSLVAVLFAASAVAEKKVPKTKEIPSDSPSPRERFSEGSIDADACEKKDHEGAAVSFCFSRPPLFPFLVFLLLQDQLRIGVTYRPDDCDSSRKTKKGDKLSMHYTGTLLKDGSKFDSSLDRGEPFTFTLGQGQVIKGWDQGES